MAYELRTFTTERLADVRARWLEIAGEDEFEVELAGPFDWCQAHLAPREGDSHALELFNTVTGDCDAILEIVDSRRGTLTKLLKLYVGPEFWETDNDPDTEARIVELHAEAYGQVIRAGIDRDVRDVKIYGRTDRMYRLLTLLRATWMSELIKWDAVMEGRWLTIKNRS